MKNARVIVCGGRDFTHKAALYDVLDACKPSEIIEGGCPTGADLFARQWAKERKCKLTTVYANWEIGTKAGPMRNAEMLLLEPDAVIAFAGNKGTADMIKKAEKAGVPIYIPIT